MALRKFQYWFYAAAIYNFFWGILNILFPKTYFRWIGLNLSINLPLWQVVGMFVLVYAPAYWWAGRFPERHYHLVLIGLIGKVLGPIGFIWSVISGQLPLAFGWVILTNDLIWLPAFFLYFAAILSERNIVNVLRGE